MHYLSSCSIVKNEYPYIFEFVKIHRALGVEFFLFFDRSDDPLENHFKNQKDIEVIHFPEPNRHAEAWREGVKYLTGKSKWVQFIDIDQVLVPVKSPDIRTMMQDYDNDRAVSFNWHTFGSNNRDFEPEPGISTYEAYTKRAIDNEPINAHVQSVVQVEYAQPVIWPNPHNPAMKPGYHFVNERHNNFPLPYNNPITQDVGFIAHYYTRSMEYWKNKLAKMRADTGTSFGSIEDFNNHQKYLNAVDDFRVKDIWLSCKNKGI